MFLNKIKLATAAVMTTGMLGAGVGWVAVPGHGTGLVSEAQADDRADRQAAEAKRQRDEARRLREQMQVLQVQLEVAEAALKAAEAKAAAQNRLADVRQEEANVRQAAEAKRQRDLADQAKAQADQAMATARKAKAELDQARAEVDRAKDAQSKAEAQLAAALSKLKQLQDQQAASRPVERKNLDVEAAEARLAANVNNFKRLENLVKQGGAPATELDRAFAEIKEAEARLAHLKNAEATRADKDALEKQLQMLLKQIQDRERARSDQAIQLRTRLIQEEERLKTVERTQSAEVDRLLKAIADGKNETEKLKLALNDLLGTHGPDHPETARRKAALNEELKTIEQWKAELNDRQDKSLAERVKARQIMIQLEEQAKLLDRTAAIEDQRLAKERAAIEFRLHPSGGGASSADQRLNDLERKLEAVARELNDLRREMKK
jgi:hypothetical protein